MELYVDADEAVWKNNPQAVLPIKSLQLERTYGLVCTVQKEEPS